MATAANPPLTKRPSFSSRNEDAPTMEVIRRKSSDADAPNAGAIPSPRQPVSPRQINVVEVQVKMDKPVPRGVKTSYAKAT